MYPESLRLVGRIVTYDLLNFQSKMVIGWKTVTAAMQYNMASMKLNVLTTLEQIIYQSIAKINGFIYRINSAFNTGFSNIPPISIGIIAEAQYKVEAARARVHEAEAARRKLEAAIYAQGIKINYMQADNIRSNAERLAFIRNMNADMALGVDSYNNHTAAYPFYLSYRYGRLEEMAQKLTAIAANTGRAVNISEENLKYWRDIAEREAINRFTTAEVKIDFGGISNIVNNNADLDGIVRYIAEGVEGGSYSSYSRESLYLERADLPSLFLTLLKNFMDILALIK